MSIHQDDNKHIRLSIEQMDQLCPVAKALSSPLRVRMIALLRERSMNVNELADALNMPVSTAALNVRQLEDAGLISTQIQPGIRGAMKLCSRKIDSVSLHLVPESPSGHSALTIHLPIGSYSFASNIQTECGVVSEHAWIGESNSPRTFYHPDRANAQMLWFKSGALEYRFSLGEVDASALEWLEISMEISSNAPLYREDWKSDIFFCVNDCMLGTYVSPGDFGGRRGRLNPSWWSSTSSQYGLQKTLRIDKSGCLLNDLPFSDVTLDDLRLARNDFISLRVGVDEHAEHVGGFNLFGERFGDYAQGIVVRAGYAE